MPTMSNAPETDWSGIVHTDAKASPRAWREVHASLCVKVEGARIRGAEVAGVFEIAEHPMPIKLRKDGLPRAHVKCLWHGRKPPSSWMHITMAGKWHLLRSYSGQVVADIS